MPSNAAAQIGPKSNHQFNQNLPELVLIEAIQQLAMKTGRITFSFFIHLSLAFNRRSPPFSITFL
jgi:hypothetical protein